MAAGSSGYDDYGALEEPLRRNFARRLSDLPRPGGGDRLLDVGAAFGYAADEAQRLGWRAFGVEVAVPVARRAAAAAADVGMLVADAPALPFRSGDFAAVTPVGRLGTSERSARRARRSCAGFASGGEAVAHHR